MSPWAGVDDEESADSGVETAPRRLKSGAAPGYQFARAGLGPPVGRASGPLKGDPDRSTSDSRPRARACRGVLVAQSEADTPRRSPTV